MVSLVTAMVIMVIALVSVVIVQPQLLSSLLLSLLEPLLMSSLLSLRLLWPLFIVTAMTVMLVIV